MKPLCSCGEVGGGLKCDSHPAILLTTSGTAVKLCGVEFERDSPAYNRANIPWSTVWVRHLVLSFTVVSVEENGVVDVGDIYRKEDVVSPCDFNSVGVSS